MTLSAIPARMINEYVYCPRLAYLEWVQGEWRENPDTADGRHAHRRVDRETGDLPEGNAGEETSFHARSLTLSDEALGVVARLDLVEADGEVATPVDYKKGKRPHTAKGAWDPERVQLCLQGMLLEKHGYKTTEGILWFAGSKEKVSIPFDPELRALTLEAIEGTRRLQSLDAPPPPLSDSPKCPRCSLAPICLPDEVNWFAEPESKPRPISVQGDERLPLYVQAPYARVRKKGHELEIEVDDAKQTARIAEISHLGLFGNAYVTSPALCHLMQAGIPVTWHSRGGWYYGLSTGFTGKNILLRKAQYKAAFDDRRCLSAARRLVRAKVLNSRTLLRRNWRADNPIQGTLDQLKDQAKSTARAHSLDQLLGIEGQAAALYFNALPGMLKTDPGTFDFSARNRRPPKDPVNAMLSFGYSLLTRTWAVALQLVGFDPFMGVYHQPRPGRPALALDMMEPFRPLIVDSCVVTAINTGEIKATHFVHRAGACGLNDSGRKTFIAIFERRLSQPITHPLFGYKLTYRRLLEVEARLFGRWLTGEIPQYPGFTTR